MNQSENQIAKEENIFFNPIELFEKCAAESKTWAEAKRAYRLLCFQQIYAIRLSDSTHVSEIMLMGNGEMNKTTLLVELLMAPDSVSSPLVDIISMKNNNLFDCIMKHYGHAAVQDEGVFKAAVKGDMNHFSRVMTEIALLPENNQNMLFDSFEILMKSRLEPEDIRERADLFLKTFPEIISYRNAEGKGLLMSAVQNAQPEVCRLLIEKGSDPFQYTDNYYNTTVYAYAYEKHLKHPKNKSYQQIISDFKQYIPDINHREWIENRVEKKLHNHKSDMRMIGITSAIVTCLGLWALYHYYDKIKDQRFDSKSLPTQLHSHIQTEKITKQPKNINPVERNQFLRQ